MIENVVCVCDNVGKRDGGEGDKMGGEGNEQMAVHEIPKSQLLGYIYTEIVRRNLRQL